MNDDKLLEGIARAARDEAAADPLDPRWDKLAAGELSDAERRALRETQADDALAERADTAFAPLDAGERAALAAAAAAALGAAGNSMAGDAREASAAEATGPDGTAGNNVVPLRRHPLRSPWALGLAASAVIAIGVVLSGDLLSPRAGPLPSYSYDLRGTAGMRSDEDGPVSVRSGEAFTLTLTPASALDAPARVRLFVDDGARLIPLEGAQIEMADSGAARITAPTAALGLGDVTVVAIIGRGDWPDRDAVRRGGNAAWRAVTVPLTVTP